MTQTHISLQNESGQPIDGIIEFLQDGAVIGFEVVPVAGIDLAATPDGTNSFTVSSDGYYSFSTSVLSDDNLFILVKKVNVLTYALIGAGALGVIWVLSKIK